MYSNLAKRKNLSEVKEHICDIKWQIGILIIVLPMES